MKPVLSKQESDRLDQKIAEAEKSTGAQFVLAVVERSDSYAEIPWKAFAFGASIAGSITLTLVASETVKLLAAAVILAVGAACALLTIFVPVCARLFLTHCRAETEVYQYAQSLFLEKELFATSRRQGLLILVSMFEHQIVLVPDTGLQSRLTDEVMQEIISGMIPDLKQGSIGRAFENGLDHIVKKLGPVAPDEAFADELPNAVVVEKGI